MLTTEFCVQRGNCTSNESIEQGTAIYNFSPTRYLAKQFVQQLHKGHPRAKKKKKKEHRTLCIGLPHFEFAIVLCQPYFARIALRTV